MTQESQEKSTETTQEKSIETQLAELRQLFGPPPVLSSENAQAYDELLARLMKSLTPRDFLEEMLVKQLADCMWEINRYTRHKTLLMERRFRQRLEFQAQRQKAAAQNKDALAKGIGERKGEPPTEPEEVLEGLVEEVDAILLKPAAELDHARALEVGIAYHERLDKALNAAILRRNDVLVQYQRYNDGLFKMLGLASFIDQGFDVGRSYINRDPTPLIPSSNK